MALQFGDNRFPAFIKIFLLVMSATCISILYTLAKCANKRTIAIANGHEEHEESDIRAAGGVAVYVNLMFEFLVRAPGRYLRPSHRPRLTDSSKG